MQIFMVHIVLFILRFLLINLYLRVIKIIIKYIASAKKLNAWNYLVLFSEEKKTHETIKITMQFVLW